MQARWHLLVVVFILANISLKAQDNGGCNDFQLLMQVAK